MWIEEKTTFHGKFYNVTGIEKAGDLQEDKVPEILVGGGGRRVLSVAGRYADIVGIHHNLSPKSLSDYPKMIRECNFDGISRKIEVVKTAAEEAGRDSGNIEFMILDWVSKVTDEPELILEEYAKRYSVPVEDIDVEDNPYLLIGDASELQRKIKRCREKTGVNYFVVGAGNEPDFYRKWAESVIKPLSGL
jgi:alkanesulfonate monooxygenase SsuD/methylene tetrahydromethanopterin reductase-like flavin-dependent oxidoreductase (luciferase family)